MVERTLGERREPADRHAQLQTGKRLRGVHVADASEPHHRAIALKPDRRKRQHVDGSTASDEQLCAGPKAQVGKIGLDVDDHLATIAVRPGNAPDDGHRVPIHHPNP